MKTYSTCSACNVRIKPQWKLCWGCFQRVHPNVEKNANYKYLSNFYTVREITEVDRQRHVALKTLKTMKDFTPQQIKDMEELYRFDKRKVVR